MFSKQWPLLKNMFYGLWLSVTLLSLFLFAIEVIERKYALLFKFWLEVVVYFFWTTFLVAVLFTVVIGLLAVPFAMFTRIATPIKKRRSRSPGTQRIVSKTGHIYLIQRLDGIYKIGLSSDLPSRLDSLSRQWGEVKLIATWQSNDARKDESLALTMTSNFYYPEGRSIEYRKMNKKQAHEFIEQFTRKLGERKL